MHKWHVQECCWDDCGGACSSQVEDPVNQSLEIQVRDSHLTGRPLLGHTSFPLSRLPADGALDAWLPVLDAQPLTANAKPVGEIHLKFTFKASGRSYYLSPVVTGWTDLVDLALDAWLPVLGAQPLTANAKLDGKIHLKFTYKASAEQHHVAPLQHWVNCKCLLRSLHLLWPSGYVREASETESARRKRWRCRKSHLRDYLECLYIRHLGLIRRIHRRIVTLGLEDVPSETRNAPWIMRILTSNNE